MNKCGEILNTYLAVQVTDDTGRQKRGRSGSMTPFLLIL
jgi:hypothetical protein